MQLKVNLARILALLLLILSKASPAKEQTWLHLKIGIVGSASSQMLESADESVRKQELDGLLIELDTPGGALDATRRMTKIIMDADYPVIVWVGPSGARAGSAGAFLLLAAHASGMAKGTNIGAAHPIQSSGKDIPEGEAQQKALNDTIAYISALAQARGKNVEMAKSFVEMSTSITAEEALSNNITDFIADSKAELFTQMMDASINLKGNAQLAIGPEMPKLLLYEPSLSEQFLNIISNPNLFYLLFMAGIIGIGFELTHPGSLIPGVLGGISLILALIAMSVLPVSLGAMGLIILAVALGIAEVFVPSFGILGIGALIAFALGSIFLVDPDNSHGLRVSLYAIAPSFVFIAGFAIYVGRSVLKADSSKPFSGGDAIIGQTATSRSDFKEGLGRVFVEGELWQATQTDDEPIRDGDCVKIIARNGLTLQVAKNSLKSSF